jgi:putative transposase
LLNVMDDYSREWLACIVDTLLFGRRVMRELTVIAERRGLPCVVVSDNGTALTSQAVLAWCRTPASNGRTSRLGAAAERLRGIVQWVVLRRMAERAPVPVPHCSETDHRSTATEYTTVCPHSSHGGTAPAEFTNRPAQGHEDTEPTYQRHDLRGAGHAGTSTPD